MLILFDFDRTLFDNRTFYPQLHLQIARTCGLSSGHYKKLQDKYYASLSSLTAFNPKKFISFLQKHINIDSSKLLPFYFANSKLYSSSLFSDTIPTLKALKQSHTLGIFSQAYRPYQLAKLKNSSLLPFFSPDHLYISSDKTKHSFVQSIPPAQIIDNDRGVISTLLLTPHLKPFWLNPLSTKKHPQAPTIHTLRELCL